MARGKRYKRIEKKHNATIILVYMIIVMSIFANNNSFSRYAEEISHFSAVTVANFSVIVNGKSVTEDTSFDLNLSPTNNYITKNNKMAPSLNDRYFEIEIDPTGTEVSLEYSFSFDFGAQNNIVLTKCTVDGIEKDNIIQNVVRGDILLEDTSQAFKDKKTIIKVYWTWNDDVENPNSSVWSNGVKVKAIVSQKIS